MPYGERRKAVRRTVCWPATLMTGNGVIGHQEAATVRTFSIAGLYLEVSHEIKPGTAIECFIAMPPEIAFGDGVVMHCRGEVVNVHRIDGRPSLMGVGMRMDQYSFSEAVEPEESGILGQTS